MIPIQIQLKNFLSYGPEPQTVNFSGYHLICLSGKNGHGKSALLDAITWAIWGQARKTSGNSKADQGLLHLGQKHMFVILEFEVNGQQYRIRREFVHTKSKPFASLDFGIMQENEKIVALTDKTIKTTQDKIEKTIGITYEAFSNSTFLRQGQSNEFSKKSPKERKDVLADILQLNQFEDQKKIAQAHAKKLHVEYKTQVSIQQRIEDELNQLNTLQEQYQTIKTSLKEVDKEKKDLQKQQTAINNEQKAVAKQVNEQEIIHKQQQELKQNLEAIKKNISSIAHQWHSTHQKIDILINEKELKKEQKQIQSALQESQEKLQKKLQFKEEYLQIKEQLTECVKHHEILYEKQLNELRIEFTKKEEGAYQTLQQQKSLETSYATCTKESNSINKELSTIDKKLSQHEEGITQYKQHESAFEKTKYQYQKLGAQVTLLQQKLEELDYKIKLVQQEQKLCTLCEQILSSESTTAVQNNLQKERDAIQQTINSFIEEGKKVKKKLHKQYEVLQQQKQQHEQSINLLTKKEELEKQLSKINKQEDEYKNNIALNIKQHKELTKEIEAIQKNVNEQTKQKITLLQLPKAKKLTKKLKGIEENAKKLAYDQKQHVALQEQFTKINNQLQAHENITTDNTKQTERKTQLFSLFQNAQNITNQLQTITEKLQKYDSLKAQKYTVQQKEKVIFDQLKQLEKKQTELLIHKGSLEQKQKKQKELHAELKTLQKEIKSLYQELIDYQEISKALGKDGIQALLIEQAIPEIENEANKVLARLTNNQTHIFIESLRDLKKGGSKETLDIKISDSFGLRDYELFSGGEAFRIDFALRIGISKLLARKAGTTLQTIFIDEGFGSQDEEGLQLIMENIYKIQDEFAKVIVVSHLSEMKEQFPVQFIVEKKRSGSTISILEQG